MVYSAQNRALWRIEDGIDTLDATGSPLALKSGAPSLCPDRWRGTQQEPENDDMAHQQERHVHGQEEPGNTKVEERQSSHPCLVPSEQQVSDAYKVEQPDKRERPSWPEP
jgi:hypothetical protein